MKGLTRHAKEQNRGDSKRSRNRRRARFIWLQGVPLTRGVWARRCRPEYQPNTFHRQRKYAGVFVVFGWQRWRLGSSAALQPRRLLCYQLDVFHLLSDSASPLLSTGKYNGTFESSKSMPSSSLRFESEMYCLREVRRLHALPNFLAHSSKLPRRSQISRFS